MLLFTCVNTIGKIIAIDWTIIFTIGHLIHCGLDSFMYSGGQLGHRAKVGKGDGESNDIGVRFQFFEVQGDDGKSSVKWSSLDGRFWSFFKLTGIPWMYTKADLLFFFSCNLNIVVVEHHNQWSRSSRQTLLGLNEKFYSLTYPLIFVSID